TKKSTEKKSTEKKTTKKSTEKKSTKKTTKKKSTKKTTKDEDPYFEVDKFEFLNLDKNTQKKYIDKMIDKQAERISKIENMSKDEVVKKIRNFIEQEYPEEDLYYNVYFLVQKDCISGNKYKEENILEDY